MGRKGKKMIEDTETSFAKVLPTIEMVASPEPVSELAKAEAPKAESKAEPKTATEPPIAEVPAPERKPVEHWAKARGHHKTYEFAAAKAHERWPAGQEITEADYDAAVARAIGVAIR